MHITQREFVLEQPDHADWLHFVSTEIMRRLDVNDTLLRFAITRSSESECVAEALVVTGALESGFCIPTNHFEVVPRPFEDHSSLNVALIVPTGIGAEIGGHAGDAGPVVKLLGSVCDTLITHPNVVNGSDINEMPENALYVEGGALSRLFMGQIVLHPVRSNRLLVVVADNSDAFFIHAAVNAVNAARSTYGLDCSRILTITGGPQMRSAYSNSGTAGGQVTNVEKLMTLLKGARAEFDAIGIASVVNVPARYHEQYFEGGGRIVNPWGGVEAMLTHTVTTVMNVPSAHAPMMEARRFSNDPGIVDPRMAAEAISMTYLQSVLKGLQRSPRIQPHPKRDQGPGIDASNISCLILPDGCVGMPTLAALLQGIRVIFVRENRNLMRNDVTRLPWRRGQLFVVDNYWEAAGIIAAMKAGIEPCSVRRPITKLQPESPNEK